MHLRLIVAIVADGSTNNCFRNICIISNQYTKGPGSIKSQCNQHLQRRREVVTNSGEEIANHAIELLKEVNTNLGPRLQSLLLEFHETYISECLDRLRAHYDTVSVLSNKPKDGEGTANKEVDEGMVNRLKAEAVKMCRVMKVLQEYIGECDGDFTVERKTLSLHRSCQGKHLTDVEDVDILTHSNDTLAALHQHILRRVKASGANVQLEPSDDQKLLSQIPLEDKKLGSPEPSIDFESEHHTETESGNASSQLKGRTEHFCQPVVTCCSQKAAVDKKLEEAYNVIKALSEKAAIRDEYYVFGEHVGSKLKNCRKSHQEISVAQHKINDILFKLEME